MTPRWNPFVIGQRKMAVALLWPLLCTETHFPPADSGSPKSTAHRNLLPRHGGAPETAVVRPEAPQNEEFNPAAVPGTNSLIFSKIYAVSIFHDFASTTGEPGFDPLSGHSRPFGQVVRHLSCIFFLPKFNLHKRIQYLLLPLAPFPPPSFSPSPPAHRSLWPSVSPCHAQTHPRHTTGAQKTSTVRGL